MTISYKNTSVYGLTEFNDYYLDVMENRDIPKLTDDVQFTINETYSMRPDLLALDLYERSDLWWVFAQRNPNTLVNPLLDFKTGTSIFIPNIDTLKNVLGF